MSKNKLESEIKLDLGNDEDEEEEEEEEEEESEESEDEKNNEVIVQPKQIDNIISTTNKEKDTKQNKEESEEEEEDEENEEEENEEEEKESKTESFKKKKMESEDYEELDHENKNEIKKLSENLQTKNKAYSKPLYSIDLKKSKIDKINRILDTNSLRNDHATKSVFTKLSEEMFNKSIKSGNKKMSSFDFMMNDNFLNRLSEKNDVNRIDKVKSFQERNKEFADKKKSKLELRKTKQEEDLMKTIYKNPNNKELKTTEVRKLDEFYNDNQKFQENIKLQLDLIKQSNDKQLVEEVKVKPKINIKSRKIANDKLEKEGILNKPLPERLANETLRKNKTYINKKQQIKDSQIIKPEVIKLTKTELEEKSKKLFEEAKLLKEKKIISEQEHFNNLRKLSIDSSSSIIVLNKMLTNWCEELKKYSVIENDSDIGQHLLQVKFTFSEFIFFLFGQGFIETEFSQEDIDLFLNDINTGKREVNKKHEKEKILTSPMKNMNTSCYFPNKVVDEEGEIIEMDKENQRERKKKFIELDLLYSLFDTIYLIEPFNENEDDNEKTIKKISSIRLLINLTAILGAYKGNDYTIKETIYNAKPKKKTEVNKKVPRNTNEKAKEKVKIVSFNNILSSHYLGVEEICFIDYLISEHKCKSIESKFRVLGNTWTKVFLDKRKRLIPIDSEEKNYSMQKNDQTELHAKAYRERCLNQIKTDLESMYGLDEKQLNDSVNLSFLNQTKSKVRLENVYQILKKKKMK